MESSEKKETGFIERFLRSRKNRKPTIKDGFFFKKSSMKQALLARFKCGKAYRSNGDRECARRRKQIEKGMMKKENGVR